MMHRCSNSQGNMAFGLCSCGVFHHSQSNSFSVPFSMPNHKYFDETDMHRFTSPSSSSSVDCTLSLGTPSTRLCENNGNKRFRHERHSSSFCLQDKNIHCSQQSAKGSRGSNGNSSSISGNDALLARRCANCDTTSTPLWRNGPRGPKSLCNACGIRFKKEERRAAKASNSLGAAASMYSWVHHPQNQKMPCFSSPVNVFWFI
ncbi:GATA transcription factor 19 [Hibiscus syriacus]|uniref:GATA transcription factor 19 n=1 Tax=Hibiscus syriacus TaxID=106335 RepID=A0A6A2Z0I5_HIBSY|nr:GATA transcription factor 18-like [Hibiscus syriacus]KAE8685394.1 GATA transcription factor 19 [Hibiscus syriacus]